MRGISLKISLHDAEIYLEMIRIGLRISDRGKRAFSDSLLDIASYPGWTGGAQRFTSQCL